MRKFYWASVGAVTLLAASVLGANLFLDGNKQSGSLVAQAAQLPSANSLVVASPAETADITIYGNAFAQVQETRKVQLKAGRNRVLLNSVASKYRPDSLRIVDVSGPGQFVYVSATYQPANLTPERLVADSIGKTIIARRVTNHGSEEVRGKLLSAGATLVIDVGNGKTELVSGHDVTLPETPQGLSNTAALVVEADVTTGGEYTINFLYDTDGLSWTAKHSLLFDDTSSTVISWESGISIVNQSGTTLVGTVRVLSDAVTAGAEAAEGAQYRSAAPMRLAAAQDASVENVGDQKVYTVPGVVTLSDGQVRQIPLFVARNVPVKREYVVQGGNAYYGRQGGQQQVAIKLSVENCEKHNLGKPLPAGPVKVYQANAANKLQVTGSTALGDKAVDEVFDLVIGRSTDIKWERKLVEAKEVPAEAQPANQGRLISGQPQPEPVFEDHTYEYTIHNYKKDRDVEVKLEMAVDAKQEAPKPFVKTAANRAEAVVKVAKNDKTTVRFTVRVRVR